MLIRFGNNANLETLDLACNTGDVGLLSNIASSTARGLPEVVNCPENGQEAVIVGGGASLLDTLENIRELQNKGAKVYALNNAAKFLFERGIKPDAQIMLDPRAQNTVFVEQRWANDIYLASQCAPEIYDACAKIGYPVKVFHALIENMSEHMTRSKTEKLLQKVYQKTKWKWAGKAGKWPLLVGGGITVGLTGMCLVYTLGHRKLHLFGYDSSYREDKSHAYSQPMNADDEHVRCTVDNRAFDCSVAMAGQANEFQNVYTSLLAEGCEIEVYGDGLLPTLWRVWKREHSQKILTAVYDLGLAPPTYDFLAFLVEAERHRVENQYDVLDVVFQPGPMKGFRDDDLPPSVEVRQGMLWRVCAGMARLVPSVRNVLVLKQRAAIQGDVFPEGYAENAPKCHYGIGYLKDAMPCLKASASAIQYVTSKIKKPYATITLRESDYWPERNSNRPEWIKVAQWLSDQGVEPVFIPDTDGTPVKTFRNFPEAIDIDIRMALYEGAVINMGISNGPMALLYASEAPYLIFRPVTESCPSTSEAFLESHGIKKGDKYAGNGKLVWDDDRYDIIVRELERFMLLEAA